MKGASVSRRIRRGSEGFEGESEDICEMTVEVLVFELYVITPVNRDEELGAGGRGEGKSTLPVIPM